MGPMMDSVVKSVPSPTTTPAKAKSMAGVKSAPPNRWMAFIMMRFPLSMRPHAVPHAAAL